jgi:hypothetical protein
MGDFSRNRQWRWPVTAGVDSESSLDSFARRIPRETSARDPHRVTWRN